MFLFFILSGHRFMNNSSELMKAKGQRTKTTCCHALYDYVCLLFDKTVKKNSNN